jgi:hypothetical protein
MSGPVPDRVAAAEFLDFLYGDREGWACVPTFDGRWNEDGRNFFRWPDQRDEVLDFAMRRAAVADVYVGMLLYSARQRRQVTALPGQVLWADVDHAFTPDQIDLLQRRPAFRIVKSGTPGHAHVYLPVNLAPAAELEVWNKKMKGHLDGDNCWDAARVLRLPGTFNHKMGECRPVGSLERVR